MDDLLPVFAFGQHRAICYRREISMRELLKLKKCVESFRSPQWRSNIIRPPSRACRPPPLATLYFVYKLHDRNIFELFQD